MSKKQIVLIFLAVVFGACVRGCIEQTWPESVVETQRS